MIWAGAWFVSDNVTWSKNFLTASALVVFVNVCRKIKLSYSSRNCLYKIPVKSYIKMLIEELFQTVHCVNSVLMTA